MSVLAFLADGTNVTDALSVKPAGHRESMTVESWLRVRDLFPEQKHIFLGHFNSTVGPVSIECLRVEIDQF